MHSPLLALETILRSLSGENLRRVTFAIPPHFISNTLEAVQDGIQLSWSEVERTIMDRFSLLKAVEFISDEDTDKGIPPEPCDQLEIQEQLPTLHARGLLHFGLSNQRVS